MIRPNILKELTECILKYNSDNTARDEIINIIEFLLGEKLSHDDDDELGWTSQYIIKLYNGECFPGSEALSELETSSDWSFQRLTLYCPTINDNIKPLLTQDIRNIYKRYLPDSSVDLAFDVMIMFLVYYHFFCTCDTAYLFSPFPFDRKRLRTCSSYISWDKKEKEFSQLLANNHLLFLTGQPASGKKQLVKHCLRTKYQHLDMFWLDAQTDIPLAQQICNIKFRCGDVEYNKALEILKAKPSSSLLVICLPFIRNEDYLFIDKYLRDIELSILIITNTPNIPECYTSINTDHRPVKYLKKIYDSFNPVHSFSNRQFNRLCNIISYNPFVIELLAKTLSSKNSSLKLINTDRLFDKIFNHGT